METFDPAQSNNTSTHNVTINVFDTLVRLSDDGKDFVGELAESWKLVDQTTWQFKLRRGVKFHNGEELNAAAVKFTFDTTMDPERKTRQRPTYVAFKEVRVDDPYTVSFITHKPYAIALTQIQYLMIVPPGYIKQVGLGRVREEAGGQRRLQVQGVGARRARGARRQRRLLEGQAQGPLGGVPRHSRGRLAHRRRPAGRGGHHRRRAVRPHQGAPGAAPPSRSASARASRSTSASTPCASSR